MGAENYMQKISIVSLFVAIFLLGWLSSSISIAVENFDIQRPFSSIMSAKELNSPSDHIKKDQIHVYDDKIIIDLKGAQWAEFTDTNSMDPILDKDANSFEIIPKNSSQINVGDIISYKPTTYSGIVVHRVIQTGNDDNGWYAIVKGDNLKYPDSDKVRFEQIHGILVGIIY